MTVFSGLLLVGCSAPAALLSVMLTLSAHKRAELAVAGGALAFSVALLGAGVTLLTL